MVKPKVKKEPPADSEAKQIKKEPSSTAPTPKKEPNFKQEFKPATLGLVNGVYDIFPDIYNPDWNYVDWDDIERMTLTLTLDSPGV